MSYNYDEQVRRRGAGIFLHVNGGGPTSGCVSATRSFLRTTLATLDPAQQPVIAIGR
jgi:L,D-peptidoglycan transpeptidase YkuD (ErfK/YbiS/YcfS/YnhG family)